MTGLGGFSGWSRVGGGAEVSRRYEYVLVRLVTEMCEMWGEAGLKYMKPGGSWWKFSQLPEV